jgi:hypothetical protein
VEVQTFGAQKDGGGLVVGWKEVELVLDNYHYEQPTKGVLVALAHFMNAIRTEERGWDEVWPGLAALQRTSGWGRRTVQRAVDQLTLDGVIRILSVGEGKESTHYAVHLNKIPVLEVGSQSTQGGVSEVPRGASEVPGVGPERYPKLEAEAGKEARMEVGTAGSRSRAAEVKTSGETPETPASQIPFPAPAKDQVKPVKTKTTPQSSGTPVPEPQSGTSRPETHGGMNGVITRGSAAAPRFVQPPAHVHPFDRKNFNPYYLARVWNSVSPNPIVGDDLTAECEMDDVSSALVGYHTQLGDRLDPTLLAHQMVWACKISDYWTFPQAQQFQLKTVKDFLRWQTQIARQYENYYAKLDPRKRRPEEVCPTLAFVLQWRERITPAEDLPITRKRTAQMLAPKACQHGTLVEDDCVHCEQLEHQRIREMEESMATELEL